MINLYGFFVVLGILVGTWIVEKIRKSCLLFTIYCLPSVFDILPWLLIPGIIGARLYHVFDYWKYYVENPRQIFLVWQGGLGIFGGILGAIVGLWIFLKFKKFGPKAHHPLDDKGLKFNQAFLSLLDLGVIGLSVGQAIGRWGNYFNQELYGLPTNLFWGIYIKPENRLAGFEDFERFHPLFLYESLGCLAIFIVLLLTRRYTLDAKRKKAGSAFFLYLLMYSFLRFWLEFLRIEGWEIVGIRVNQVLSLGLVLISGLAICKKSVKIKI